MANISWNGGSGDWSNQDDWTPEQVPGSSDTAIISGTAPEYVLISGSETETVGGILLDNAAGTLEVDGLLSAGTITLSAGTIADYGTIANATIVNNGGTLEFGYGLLHGDTIVGTLDVGGEGLAVVQGGLTVQNSDGTPGTITIDGGYSTLLFNDSETFDNATIIIGSTSGYDNLSAGGTVTFGQGVLIETPDNFTYATLGGNGTIINGGSIVVDATSGTMALESPSFINNGNITVAGGADLDIQPYGTFANNGRLAITDGGTIAIQYLTAFTNTGSIQIGSGSELDLYTYATALTQAQTVGGTVEIDGVLNASGETIDITPTGAFSELDNDGTIENATLVLSGGTLGLTDGSVFQNDTIQGALTIGDNDYVVVQSGFVVSNTDGSAGTIALTGAEATLEVADNETLNNVTIVMGNATDIDTLEADGVLTLGSGTVLETTGTIGTDMLGGAGTIINDGTVLLDAASGTVVLETTDFDNEGVLAVSGGVALEIEVFGTFANGGTISVGSGSTVTLEDATAFTNTGLIQVGSGAQLDLYTYAPDMSQGQTVGGTLVIDGVVDAGGNTVSLDSAGAFSEIDNNGTLENTTLILNGGVLNLTSGSVFNNDTIEGTLTIGGTDYVIVQSNLVVDNTDGTPGTIDMTSADATLEVDGLLSAGTIDLSAGTILDAGTIANSTIVMNGGTIEFGFGLLQGDTVVGALDLEGTGITEVQSGLTVQNSDGTPGTITIDGGATLLFNDNETFDNATIVMGGSGLNNLNAGGTVTLGEGVLVETAGSFGFDTLGGLSLTNEGSILVDATSGTMAIEAGNFTNDGDITVAGGADLEIQPFGTFANNGRLAITDGGTIAIQFLTAFTNTGSIQIGSGSELDLDTYATALTQAQTVGGTVEIDGLLNADGETIDITPTGAFSELDNDGTIENATLVLSGGTLGLTDGSVFQNDTIEGALTIGDNDYVVVQSGFVVSNTDGTPGTVNLTGAEATLEVADSETIDNVTIVMGNATDIDTLEADGVLTLGQGVLLETAGTIGTDMLGGAGTIINDGSILADAASGTVVLETTDFDNEGNLTVNGGVALEIEVFGTFANDGRFAISGGSTVTLQDATAFTNTGVIQVGSGAQLNLYTYAPDMSQGQTVGGTLVIDGVVDAGGNVISLDSAGAFSEIDNNGTLENATLILNGGSLNLGSGSVLQNDTIEGTLTIGDNDYVVIQSGFVVSNTDGTPGTINLTGAEATLEVTDNETIDNVTIVMGNATDIDTLEADGVLTLGQGVLLETTGTIGTDMLGGAGTIINDGSILADAASGTVVLETTDFDNEGNLTVNGGVALEIEVFGTFANDGRFAISGGSTVTLQDATAFTNTGVIQVGSGAQLDLYTYAPDMSQGQTVGGTLVIDGVVDAGGNVISLDSAGAFSEIDNNGTLENATLILNGGVLNLASGSVLQNDTIEGALTIGDNDYVVIQSGFVVSGTDGMPAVINLTGADATLEVADDETFNATSIVIGNADGVSTLTVDETLTLGSNTTIETAPTIVSDAITGAGTVINEGSILADAASGNLVLGTTDFTNDGLIAVTGGASLNIQPFDTFDNAGTLSIASGSVATVSALNSFLNEGSIIINGGSLLVGALLDGSGGITDLSNSGTLELGAGSTADQTINFLDGTGTFILDDVADFGGTVAGFVPGDSIVLDGFAGATESFANGVLTFVNTSTVLGQTITTTGTIQLAGNYQASDFSYTTDANGDLIVSTDVLPCFAAGTRIRTADGEVAVEALREGDQVVTVTDGKRRLMPIVWIGRRAIDISRHPAPEKVQPVRVQRGAFGRNVPARDLLLSPDHAIFAEGVLVPVKYLVNGTTVRVEVTATAVEYFHVELAAHEVVLAEGLATESYLEAGSSRAMFENGGLPIVLHADFSHIAWDVLGCAPLKVTGPEVERIRARLARSASRGRKVSKKSAA